MARIVLSTFGSLGDLHPYLAIALGLRDRGHRVALASGGVYREKIAAEGIDFFPLRPDVSPDDRELIASAMDLKKGPERILRDIMFPAIRESAEDLLAAARGADLLVTHPLTFAGPPIAELLGIRWASAVLAPIGFFSAHDPSVLPPYPRLAHLRRLGPRVNGWILNYGRRATLPWTAPVARLRADLGLPPGAHPVFEGQFSPHLVLALFSPLLAAPQPPTSTASSPTGVTPSAPRQPASGSAARTALRRPARRSRGC